MSPCPQGPTLTVTACLKESELTVWTRTGAHASDNERLADGISLTFRLEHVIATYDELPSSGIAFRYVTWKIACPSANERILVNKGTRDAEWELVVSHKPVGIDVDHQTQRNDLSQN